MSRFRFNTPQTTQRNTARIEMIAISPRVPLIEFIVSFGDDSGGTYVEASRETFVMEAPLPPAVVTLMGTFVSRAFDFLRARGVIPAGTEEA